MTESTSYVEQQIAARIQAQRIRVAAAKETRASLAEARKAGLRRRHAAKLARLAEASRVDTATTADHDQDDGEQHGDGPEAA